MTHPIPDALRDFLQQSGVPLTLADATVEDCPLVYCNEAFTRLTGYGPDEVLGRNCRFLQPPEGAGPVRDRIRAFLATDTDNTERFLLPNRRKDGSPFVNVLYMTKIYRDGRCVFVLGSQFDAARIDGRRDTLYDDALREDVTQIAIIAGDTGYLMFGSVETLATSTALIAKSRGENAP